jgi:hypothetical protein
MSCEHVSCSLIPLVKAFLSEGLEGHISMALRRKGESEGSHYIHLSVNRVCMLCRDVFDRLIPLIKQKLSSEIRIKPFRPQKDRAKFFGCDIVTSNTTGQRKLQSHCTFERGAILMQDFPYIKTPISCNCTHSPVVCGHLCLSWSLGISALHEEDTYAKFVNTVQSNLLSSVAGGGDRKLEDSLIVSTIASSGTWSLSAGEPSLQTSMPLHS